MKSVDFQTKMDPATALIHVFEYYAGKNLMIMMTQNLFKKFEECSNAQRTFTVEEEVGLNDLCYDIFENTEKREKCGTAIFTPICGVWVLKIFHSRTFKYTSPVGPEPDTVILIK